MNKNFAANIIDWYQINKRDLPWRETKDPYTIWLSEIILQQTRVDQGLPYFEKFISSYPSITNFAAASEDDILKKWQGLGYYSRARNMIICAHTVVSNYSGVFPNEYKELIKLKGIGKYTAAAIASICFNEPVSVIDGNVYRVLSRIFGMENDLSDSKTYNVFFEKAQQLIDITRPDIFNQSIMEFGALHCTPKNPSCDVCVFSTSCFANINNMQSYLPVKTRKIKKRIRRFIYLIITHRDKLLIKKRPEGDIWSGLYDFLLVEMGHETDKNKSILRFINDDDLSTSSKEYKHILTHQTIFARFYQIEINSINEFENIKNDHSLIEIAKDTLQEYPVSTLIHNFLENNYI